MLISSLVFVVCRPSSASSSSLAHISSFCPGALFVLVHSSFLSLSFCLLFIPRFLILSSTSYQQNCVRWLNSWAYILKSIRNQKTMNTFEVACEVNFCLVTLTTSLKRMGNQSRLNKNRKFKSCCACFGMIVVSSTIRGRHSRSIPSHITALACQHCTVRSECAMWPAVWK